LSVHKINSMGSFLCCFIKLNKLTDLVREHYFTCPHCGEQISFLVDLTVDKQNYIEDCEICCNPIKVDLKIEENNIALFEAKAE
jgi:transcription elongation factor Elf1